MKFINVLKICIAIIFSLNYIFTLKTEFSTEFKSTAKTFSTATAKSKTNTENRTNNRSQNKIGGGINMSAKFFKSYKSRNQKGDENETPNVALPIPAASPTSAPQTATTAPAVPTPAPQPQIPPECNNIPEIFQQPQFKSDSSENSIILFTTWLKFLIVKNVPDKKKAPLSFYRNDDFYEQFKLFPGVDVTKFSHDGINNLEEYIKSPSYYYAVLFPNNLNILTSRQVML
jgi:hypothetical protein